MTNIIPDPVNIPDICTNNVLMSFRFPFILAWLSSGIWNKREVKHVLLTQDQVKYWFISMFSSLLILISHVLGVQEVLTLPEHATSRLWWKDTCLIAFVGFKVLLFFDVVVWTYISYYRKTISFSFWLWQNKRHGHFAHIVIHELRYVCKTIKLYQ